MRNICFSDTLHANTGGTERTPTTARPWAVGAAPDSEGGPGRREGSRNTKKEKGGSSDMTGRSLKKITIA